MDEGKRHFTVGAETPKLLIKDRAWKNLIILDACRFDFFIKINTIHGKLRKVVSAGSWTPEWYEANFKDTCMKDVVYFSANPIISNPVIRKKYDSIPFHKIVDIWKDGWNETLGTVPPWKVNRVVLEKLKAHRRWRNKRLIIHYLQPHAPYIGNLMFLEPRPIENFTKPPAFWDKVRDGQIPIENVKQAYASNLSLVLQYVKKIIPHLNGKTCVTSDHGELFGENGVFGHPSFEEFPELKEVSALVEVPWLEVS